MHKYEYKNLILILINFTQFFYKEYKHKTIARLNSFEKEFDGPLEAEQKRQKKVTTKFIMTKMIIIIIFTADV